MRKLYLLVFVLFAAFRGNTQTIPNAGMETWRTGSAGGAAPVTIEAPTQWYGADSTVIAMGQFFGSLISIPPSAWKRQTFKESTIVHGGSYSAKLMTRDQDTLGIFPGILSNANATVLITVTGGSPSFGGITYHGGTAVTQRPTSVKAWVRYDPGKDSTGATGIDSGRLTVQALSTIGGQDSIIGIGIVTIPPTGGSWMEVTAPVTYSLPDNIVDTVRITFTSSRGINNLDSSTLYIDDLSMTSVPQSVSELSAQKIASVYPNPAKGSLYIDGSYNGNATLTLMSIAGQTVAVKTLTGKDVIDLTALAPGIYCYTISDGSNSILQKGQVTVTR